MTYFVKELKADVTDQLEAGFSNQASALSAVGSPVTVNIDFEDSNLFTLTMPDSGVTLSNPTNKEPGVWILYAIANSGGNSSLSFDSDYNIVSGSFNGTANTVNILELISDGSEVDVIIQQR